MLPFLSVKFNFDRAAPESVIIETHTGLIVVKNGGMFVAQSRVSALVLCANILQMPFISAHLSKKRQVFSLAFILLTSSVLQSIFV